MARTFLNFITMVAFALPFAAHAGTRAKTSAKATEATPPAATATAANVNYDDPNMAYSPDYAADTAITCPKTLKGRKLRECLLKNGLAVGEEISESAEILANPPSTSYH